MEKFEWTDALIKEFFEKNFGCGRLDGDLEKFKQSKQSKQPLFTTVDGKDIYHNDTYWWVCENDDIVEFGADKEWTGKQNGGFSTKEAAEKWLVDNKPCLSVNDICSLWSIDFKERAALIQLAKQKINQK